jgi:hypothetical protein
MVWDDRDRVKGARENMSKTEFQALVQLEAGHAGMKWHVTDDEIRSFDPVLAELYGRYRASAEALWAYCKGRTEGE